MAISKTTTAQSAPRMSKHQAQPSHRTRVSRVSKEVATTDMLTPGHGPMIGYEGSMWLDLVNPTRIYLVPLTEAEIKHAAQTAPPAVPRPAMPETPKALPPKPKRPGKPVPAAKGWSLGPTAVDGLQAGSTKALVHAWVAAHPGSTTKEVAAGCAGQSAAAVGACLDRFRKIGAMVKKS